MSNKCVVPSVDAISVASRLTGFGRLKGAENPVPKGQFETRFAAMAALMLSAAADPVQAASLLKVVSDKADGAAFALQDHILAEMDRVLWSGQSGSVAQTAAVAVSAARAAFEAGL